MTEEEILAVGFAYINKHSGGSSGIVTNGSFVKNGTYYADEIGYNGYNVVDVNVKAYQVINKSLSSYINSYFNEPVTIAEGAACDSIFAGMTAFNQPVVLPDVASYNSSFLGCTSFNSPVEFGNTAWSMVSTFNGCIVFNQPVNMPDTVTRCEYTFSNCRALNQPIHWSNNLSMARWMFYPYSNFNQPIDFPSTLRDAYYMLCGCAYFNQPLNFRNISGGKLSCADMLSSCISFNSDVDFGDNISSVSDMFYNCSSFNRPITLPQYLNSYFRVFLGCTSFNQPITLPNTLNDIRDFVFGCTSFNQTMIIDTKNSILSGYMVNQAFRGCTSLASPIYITADKLYNALYTFVDCPNLKDVYIIGIKNTTQFRGAFRNGNTSATYFGVQCNIYTDDAGQNILYNTQLIPSGSYSYRAPEWTNDPDNGCIYNTLFNLYIYNNWDGVLPS